MGLFDWVEIPEVILCSECDKPLSGFQTKDGDPYCAHVDFCSVDRFYVPCKWCGTWHEWNLKPEFRQKLTLQDYELTVKKETSPESLIRDKKGKIVGRNVELGGHKMQIRKPSVDGD